MTTIAQKRIADIVTENFKAAEIMEKYGLDFCCKGKISLVAACEEKQLDLGAIVNELENLSKQGTNRAFNFSEWKPGVLVDFIVHNHHEYVRGCVERISAHTQRVASRHGDHNPFLMEIAEYFSDVAQELTFHMQKEETMLFPYIKRLEEAAVNGAELPVAPFGSVENPIRHMMEEHEDAGDLMYKIRNLTNNFTPPANACNTWRVTYAELDEFEKDLHQHVHLENNILFPQAIALQSQLSENNKNVCSL